MSDEIEREYYHHRGLEIVQMMRQLEAMPGRRVIDELISLDVSIYIYGRNYQEAVRFFDFIKNDPENQDLWHQQSVAKKQTMHRETSRLLQNHVAAVQALLEHMGRIHERLYKPAGTMPDYAGKASAFSDDPLVGFVRSLRNILLHNETATTMLHVSISDGRCVNDLGLPVAFLEKHRNWLKGSSKQYLQDEREFVNIPDLLAAHDQKVSELVNWFHQRMQIASFDEIRQYADLEERLFRVQIEDHLDAWFFDPDPTRNTAPGDLGLFHGLLDRTEFEEIGAFPEGSQARAHKAIEVAERHMPLSETIKAKLLKAYSNPDFFRTDAFRARTIEEIRLDEGNRPS